MKSIRLSLVGYFLILLVGALGAVSWLVYQTASRTLQEKERSTANLVTAKCNEDIRALHDAFDQRLLAEAEKLASLSKDPSEHNEFFYPLGMLAAAPMPMAHLLIPTWVAEAAHPALVGRLEGEWITVPNKGTGFGFPTFTFVPTGGSGAWLSEAASVELGKRLGRDAPERANEFIQIERVMHKSQYHSGLFSGRKQTHSPEALTLLKHPDNFVVVQYSESLGGLHLPMSDKERLSLEEHRFDEVELAPGKKARRVTIRRDAERPKSGREYGMEGSKIWCRDADLKDLIVFEGEGWPSRGERTRDGRDAGKDKTKDKTKDKVKGKGPATADDKSKSKGPLPTGGEKPRPYYYYYEFLPFVFVHYAEDTSGLRASQVALESERDRQLLALADGTRDDLRDLRSRLGWIGASTFVGILVGSWLLICLGLSPLSRLSDAVSKVTPRDFRLKIDQKKLPIELMPIAGRMSEALEQLGKAYAREKQAAADISHELRTPLAALLTTAEVGLKKTRTPEEYRELLQDCRLSGEQMMQLVERLLALARLDANADRLRPAPVDVGKLAQQCADMVRPLADARGLDLQVHAGPSLSVQADGGKLREVLTNLLHNAIQYNKPEGSIDLSVQRENGHLLMQVRDTGIGISAEAREHIFERFYRADPSRHSDTPHAGLGLAIVKSYVDLMGGRIDVDSSPAGSTFRIEVPAVDVAPSSASSTAARVTL